MEMVHTHGTISFRNYSTFTNFTELFSLDSFKTTERMVIKLCMRQSCGYDIWLQRYLQKKHSVKLVNAL